MKKILKALFKRDFSIVSLMIFGVAVISTGSTLGVCMILFGLVIGLEDKFN